MGNRPPSATVREGSGMVADQPEKRRRRTPIEMWIEDKSTDRRTRWEREQHAKGLTRVCVRVHVDDIDKVKAYCARLLKEREGKP